MRNAVIGTVVTAACLAAAFAAVSTVTGGDGSDEPRAGSLGGDRDNVITTLLVGTRESGSVGEVVWLSLLSVDQNEDRGAIAYVPAHTAVEVPGRGLMAVGDALPSGGMPLLLVSVENMLGIEIDRYVDMSEQDARLLFEATGPISVEVPTEVRVAAGRDQARLIFTPGLQRLPSEFLVQLLYTVGIDGDDEELGSRHLAFWDAFFAAFEDDPAALAAAVEEAGGALSESDADAQDHARFFERLVEFGESDVSIATLPVSQVSVGGDELYQTDRDELVAFVDSTFGEVAPPADEIRVQILNGNGVPGIGQEVADLLVGQGFRVILSGNAGRLNYRKTLVVTYDSSPEGQQIAHEARALIGVGEVQVSAQDQDIVDITIVVGRDFVERT